MQQFRFIITYILMVLLCMVPSLFGFSELSMLFSALLLMWYLLLNGPLASGIGAVMVFFAYFTLSGQPLEALAFMLSAGLPVGVLIFLLPQNFRLPELLCAVTVSNLLPFCWWQMLLAKGQGFALRQVISTGVDVFSETLKTQGIADTQEAQMMLGMFRDMEPYLEGMIPGIFLITSVAFAYTLIWATGKMTNQMGAPFLLGFSFSCLKAKWWMCILFLLLPVLCIFIPSQRAQIYLLDILLLLGFLLFASGLSFLDYYLRRGIKSEWLRLMLYILGLNLLSVFFLPIFILIGGIDGFANFRRLGRGENREGNKADTAEENTIE